MRICAFVVGLLLVLGACRTPKCPVGTTHCNGNVAEACLADGTWGRFADCDEVSRQSGGEWLCCDVHRANGQMGAACVPKAECAHE
jgi:hypothetical protein